jgi:hypothetical protein
MQIALIPGNNGGSTVTGYKFAYSIV